MSLQYLKRSSDEFVARGVTRREFISKAAAAARLRFHPRQFFYFGLTNPTGQESQIVVIFHGHQSGASQGHGGTISSVGLRLVNGMPFFMQ